MIKEILIYPKDKEILTSKSEDVTDIESVRDVIQDLKDTLNNTETGIGISAVQIGVLKKICIIKPEADKLFVMINPVITKTEGNCLFKEGCLSTPNAGKVVQRANKVTVEYIDENGKKRKITRGGLTAIIIQHEIDHFLGWCHVFEAVEEDK